MNKTIVIFMRHLRPALGWGGLPESCCGASWNATECFKGLLLSSKILHMECLSNEPLSLGSEGNLIKHSVIKRLPRFGNSQGHTNWGYWLGPQALPA